jgi:DNA-binding LacI/PurR family transcriptional regulator
MRKRKPRTNVNKSNPVGLLIYSENQKSYEWQLIRKLLIKIEAILSDAGYHIVTFPVSEKSSSEEIRMRVSSASITGLFSIHYGNSDFFQSLEDTGVPVILINNCNFQSKFHSICTDEF